LTIYICLLSVPCTHGKNHAVLHVVEHLGKRLAGASASPTIIDVHTKVFPDYRTLECPVMTSISWGLNVQCGQINSVATLHIETTDVVVVELGYHREWFIAINLVASTDTMPFPIVIFVVVGGARAVAERVQATSTLIADGRRSAEGAFAFRYILSIGTASIDAGMSGVLLSLGVGFKEVHLRAKCTTNRLSIAVFGSRFCPTFVLSHTDEIRGGIETARHSGHLHIEGEFLAPEHKHRVLVHTLIFNQVHARPANLSTSMC
jgi:hypothetical protein